MFFVSIFLFCYEKYQRKKNNSNNTLTKKRTKKFKLIYKDQLKGRVSIIKILLVVFLLVIETEFQGIYYSLGFSGLDYWMFELLFIYYISSSMLSTSMYAHQKYSMFFVFIFCSLMKTISTTISYFDERRKIYKTYNIFIPIGILIFIFNSYLRAYVVCKLKWLMDLKYIISGQLLMYYGLIGAFITSLTCVLITLYPCGDTLISYEEMTYICKQEVPYNNGTHNITYNYYDNYYVFVQQLLTKDTFLNTCILLLRTNFCFLTKLFSILIIKYLSPAFLICANYIFFFISRLVGIIIDLISDKRIEKNIFLDFTIEIFSMLGILVYIEFIELNFCKLNYNLKKNIILRSMNDTKTSELNELLDEDEEEEENNLSNEEDVQNSDEMSKN